MAIGLAVASTISIPDSRVEQGVAQVDDQVHDHVDAEKISVTPWMIG